MIAYGIYENGLHSQTIYGLGLQSALSRCKDGQLLLLKLKDKTIIIQEIGWEIKTRAEFVTAVFYCTEFRRTHNSCFEYNKVPNEVFWAAQNIQKRYVELSKSQDDTSAYYQAKYEWLQDYLNKP